tara:strand:- start:1695 stop:1889 length:195 start_codon:yes stop_codon:yes gene_type:complete
MFNTKELPIKDILISGVIIFTISTLIANIYNPLWGVTYAFLNILTLSFLGWLYRDSWDSNNKNN